MPVSHEGPCVCSCIHGCGDAWLGQELKLHIPDKEGIFGTTTGEDTKSVLAAKRRRRQRNRHVVIQLCSKQHADEQCGSRLKRLARKKLTLNAARVGLAMSSRKDDLAGELMWTSHAKTDM